MFVFLAIATLLVGIEAKGLRSRRSDDLTVGFKLEAPFFQEANGGYEGYIPDLLEAISPLAGLTFAYKPTDDVYGLIENGNLTGLLGMAQRGEVDIAAGPLSITSAREQLVTFSKPFHSTSLTTLVRRPAAPYSTNRMFAYFRPFTAGTWAVFVICTILTGLLFYVNTKFHPKENTEAAKPTSIGSEGLRIADAFWWITRSFGLQGAESRPKSIAGRILCIAWIFFVLDSLFIYLATLIHNVPVYYAPIPAQPLPFSDLEGMIESGYSFGTEKGTSGQAFFQNTNVAVYQEMADGMTFVDSIDDGLSQLAGGNFVLFVDNVEADYYAARDCNLEAKTVSINSQSYAFAFPQSSNYTSAVSDALLRLQEDGNLEQIARKWLEYENNCPAVGEAQPTPTEVKIGMESFGGPVLILILGLLVALVVAVMEVLVIRRNTKAYDVEETKDPEKQPMLAAEEGQAVQYEEEGKSDGEVKGEPEEEKKDDGDSKVDLKDEVKAEDADDVKSAPIVEEDSEDDVKKPISEDEEEKKEEQAEEADIKAAPEEEPTKPEEEAPKEDAERKSDDEEKKDDEPEKVDSETKDSGTEKQPESEAQDTKEAPAELKIEEDQNKTEATQ